MILLNVIRILGLKDQFGSYSMADLRFEDYNQSASLSSLYPPAVSLLMVSASGRCGLIWSSALAFPSKKASVIEAGRTKKARAIGPPSRTAVSLPRARPFVRPLVALARARSDAGYPSA